MVTCSLWCSLAARSISMRALGDTRTPSVSTTWPSTFTQPLSIQRSASRREHRPSSPMRLERRGLSGFSGVVGARVMQEKRAGSLADPPRYGRVRERTEKIGRLGLPQGVREGFDFANTLTDLDAVV